MFPAVQWRQLTRQSLPSSIPNFLFNLIFVFLFNLIFLKRNATDSGHKNDCQPQSPPQKHHVQGRCHACIVQSWNHWNPNISMAPPWLLTDQQSPSLQLSSCVWVHVGERETERERTCSFQDQLEIDHPSQVHIYQDAIENLMPITSWEQCQSCLSCVQNMYTGICHFSEHQQPSKPANNRIIPTTFIHNNLHVVQPEELEKYNPRI